MKAEQHCSDSTYPGKERALIMSMSNASSDPRVDRQIHALRSRFAVTVAAQGPPVQADARYVALEPPRSLRLASKTARESLIAALPRLLLGQVLRVMHAWSWLYWLDPSFRDRRRRLLEEPVPDVVIVNDLLPLPLAFATARGAPVVYDAHEYSEGQYASLRWRLLQRPQIRHMTRTLVPKTSAMMTVSEGIASRYEEDTGVRATVVTNAPPFQSLEPSPVGETIRLVHWGNAAPQRRLDLMLKAMKYLDERFTLDLMLIRGGKYQEELERMAGGDSRIRFLEPVLMRDLPAVGNAYDVGVYVLPPGNANQRLALPNKFFEFVQARLAVVIGPSPEMMRVAENFGFGVIARDFTPEALAEALAGLDHARLVALKQCAHAAARELCAERNEQRVMNVVDTALRHARPQPN